MPRRRSFRTVKACVFDAYGTLFDVHAAVAKHRERLGTRALQVSSLWRTKQLEYTWLRSLMDRYADFWQVTADALDYALEVFDVADELLRDDLLEAYLELDCYPEVPETLRKLKARGVLLAILSNGTPAMLEAAVRNSGLEDVIAPILSVEELGLYKPAPQVYQLAVDKLDVPAKEIAFESASAWDIAGAASFGFRTVWINRFGQRRERLPFGPERELKSLAELPTLLGV